jgi:predicted DNA-binding transcriptional regulator AlpA
VNSSPNDLLTAHDVALHAGLPYRQLWTYQSRGTLPQADTHLGNKPLWYRSTVESWDYTKIQNRKPRKEATT